MKNKADISLDGVVKYDHCLLSTDADFGAKRKTKKEEALDEARRVGRNHSKHQAYLVQLAKERVIYNNC